MKTHARYPYDEYIKVLLLIVPNAKEPKYLSVCECIKDTQNADKQQRELRSDTYYNMDSFLKDCF
jgi:hypothetical protein